jgi:hypothetical protein
VGRIASSLILFPFLSRVGSDALMCRVLVFRVRYEFLKMAEEEQKLRDKIVIEGIETCMRMTKEDEQVMRTSSPSPSPSPGWLTGPPLRFPPSLQEEDCRQCSVCLYDCYLSAVTCACKDNKQIVCLRHSKKISFPPLPPPNVVSRVACRVM